MFTHTHTILAGVLLAVPISQQAQCGLDEPDDGVTGLRSGGPSRSNLELLGKHVFYDKISVPKRMACVTCHDPAVGWTYNKEQINKHQVGVTGADPHKAGGIKPPSNAYVHRAPFKVDCGPPLNLPCGGLFWDGRAEGNELPGAAGASEHVGAEVFMGDAKLASLYQDYLGTLADQALNPFPNPDEQNIERKQVCQHVAAAQYAPLFKLSWGKAIDCSSAAAVDLSFKQIAVALAAWQSSEEVNPFNSKRDVALAADIKAEGSNVSFPLAGFTAEENLGHELFYGKARCAACHSNTPVFGADPNKVGLDPRELYTDGAYHNIGVPRNPEIPGPEGSPGVGGRTGDKDHDGLHKTPTLRNVAKRKVPGFVKAYTHNGWFKSLESLIHFYNTSDVSEDGETAKSYGVTRCDPNKKDWTEAEALAANCWPEPEETGSLATGFVLGDLGLSLAEEKALVAYIKTFTDTKTPSPPKPWK